MTPSESPTPKASEQEKDKCILMSPGTRVLLLKMVIEAKLNFLRMHTGAHTRVAASVADYREKEERRRRWAMRAGWVPRGNIS